MNNSNNFFLAKLLLALSFLWLLLGIFLVGFSAIPTHYICHKLVDEAKNPSVFFVKCMSALRNTSSVIYLDASLISALALFIISIIFYIKNKRNMTAHLHIHTNE